MESLWLHNWTKFWIKLGSCNLIVEDPNPSRVCRMRRVVDNPALPPFETLRTWFPILRLQFKRQIADFIQK